MWGPGCTCLATKFRSRSLQPRGWRPAARLGAPNFQWQYLQHLIISRFGYTLDHSCYRTAAARPGLISDRVEQIGSVSKLCVSVVFSNAISLFHLFPSEFPAFVPIQTSARLGLWVLRFCGANLGCHQRASWRCLRSTWSTLGCHDGVTWQNMAKPNWKMEQICQVCFLLNHVLSFFIHFIHSFASWEPLPVLFDACMLAPCWGCLIQEVAEQPGKRAPAWEILSEHFIMGL